MWWQWLIFALLMIIIPLSIVNLAIWVKKKNNLTNEQEKVMGVNMVKYTLFYWLCDLFYMSFIIESLACNRRLKMELEYLKKLDALVRKRMQAEKKKQK